MNSIIININENSWIDIVTLVCTVITTTGSIVLLSSFFKYLLFDKATLVALTKVHGNLDKYDNDQITVDKVIKSLTKLKRKVLDKNLYELISMKIRVFRNYEIIFNQEPGMLLHRKELFEDYSSFIDKIFKIRFWKLKYKVKFLNTSYKLILKKENTDNEKTKLCLTDLILKHLTNNETRFKYVSHKKEKPVCIYVANKEYKYIHFHSDSKKSYYGLSFENFNLREDLIIINSEGVDQPDGFCFEKWTKNTIVSKKL